MGTKDKRIDAYIAKSKPFAQPILKHLRKIVHQGCPDVQETIKWGMASFDYKGPFVSMAAFKEHAVFGFWKGKLLKDSKNLLGERAIDGGEAMGHLGRITSVKDLPPDKDMLNFIKQAKKLNDDGVKLPPKPKKPKTELVVPDYFIKFLSKKTKASQNFSAFSYSHKKEYVEWITDAKSEETRNRRMETALEWIAEDKGRNWKYERK